MRSAVLSVVTILGLPCLLHAQQAILSTQQPIENGADAARRDLQQQLAVLMDRASTAQQREQAAQRLVSRASREADDILDQVLTDSTNRDGHIAVAKALAADSTPDPRFVEPLANLLGLERVTEPAALALAAFKDNDRARERLSQFVRNLSQPPSVRMAGISAIGKLVDRRAAGTLIELLADNNPQIREAAADALVDLTGLSQYGRNVQLWTKWWEVNRNRSDAEWASELLQRNAQRVGEMESRLARLREEVDRSMRRDYGQAPEGERIGRLTAYLQSESEDVRLLALQIVLDQIGGGRLRPVPEQLIQTLRAMVGDSSTDVRGLVARTLTAANDPGAVAALLAQLAQENDPDVRAKIILALGPAHDLRAVEPLLARLYDESFDVARAAADALAELAGTLRDGKNADLAGRVAVELRERLKDTERKISAVRLRESLVEAMARIGHPSSLNVFFELINARRETDRVRIAALRGLRLIGNPDSANMIIPLLEDPEREIRTAAIEALGTTASFGHADALGRLLSETVERSPEVRERAWALLARLFETATERELQRWAQQFKGNTEVDLKRRLAVLLIAERKLDAVQDQERLALVRQNLGETLLNLAAKSTTPADATARAEEAAVRFRQALDYWAGRRAVPAVVLPIANQLLAALIRAKKYPEAVQFANEGIQSSIISGTDVWLQIKPETERLERARDLDSALRLIQEAKKIPLDEIHSYQLRMKEDELRRILGTGGRIWMPRLERERYAWAAACLPASGCSEC